MSTNNDADMDYYTAEEIAERKRKRKMYNDRYRSTLKGQQTTRACQKRIDAKLKESEKRVAMTEQKNVVEAGRADCEGECDFSCEDCKWFYALTDDWPQWKVHPYFERMGLPLPAKWPSYDPYRPDYESEEAMCGTRCIAGNEHRKHPLLGLLQEAYTFVMLPEPVGQVSGPAAGVKMPSYDQAMAMPCSRLCRAQPRTVRAWRSFCNGPWSGSVGYDAYGFCKRCSVLGPATRMREALQEEAEMQLHEAMMKSAKAWQSSFKEGKAGVEWRRQFKAQLQERVQKRAAAGVIAAAAARRQARGRYAALV
jgi:hypothetical protein